MNLLYRDNMNAKQLEEDDNWYMIINKFIPDSETMIDFYELENGVIMAVSKLITTEIFHGYKWENTLDIYYGNNYGDLFFRNGFFDKLITHDDEYLKYRFTEKEIKLIKLGYGGFENDLG